MVGSRYAFWSLPERWIREPKTNTHHAWRACGVALSIPNDFGEHVSCLTHHASHITHRWSRSFIGATKSPKSTCCWDALPDAETPNYSQFNNQQHSKPCMLLLKPHRSCWDPLSLYVLLRPPPPTAAETIYVLLRHHLHMLLRPPLQRFILLGPFTTINQRFLAIFLAVWFLTVSHNFHDVWVSLTRF